MTLIPTAFAMRLKGKQILLFGFRSVITTTKTPAHVWLCMSILGSLQISIIMSYTSKCIISIDVLSMCTLTHLHSQLLTGIATVRTNSVGQVEDPEPS